MRKLFILFLFTGFLIVQSCKNNENNSEDTDYGDEGVYIESSEEGYSDGTYAADVDYYNPDTGTRSSYTLNVEVENNEVTVIHWPNGGWLDDSHFSPQELDSSGSCSFISDKGYHYTIQITGSETSYTDEYRARSDAEDDQEAVTCPECGGEKDNYDDLCWYCERKEKRKKEDIEEHTCKRCGQYDSFMFSTDDLCSDCEREEEDRKREEKENE